MRFRADKTGLNPPPPQEVFFSTGHSKAVPLLQFCYVCASVVSYVTYKETQSNRLR